MKSNDTENKELDRIPEALLAAMEAAGLTKTLEDILKSHTDRTVSKALSTREKNITEEKKSFEERIAELEKVTTEQKQSYP